MGVQSLDTNTDTNTNTKYVNIPPPNDRKLFYDSRCNFLLTNDMLLKLHKLAAAKRFKSASELIRSVVEQHLKAEGM
jgi:hypothetical protein